MKALVALALVTMLACSGSSDGSFPANCASTPDAGLAACADVGCVGIACGSLTPEGVCIPNICSCWLADGGVTSCDNKPAEGP